MAVNNFENAQLVFTLAKTVVETHDAILGKYAKGRVDFDLAMIRPGEDLNPSRIMNQLDAVLGDVLEFERRVLSRTPLNSFETFRRFVYKAQNQLSELFQYMEIIDNSEYYMSIYEQSGVGPQKKDSEVYNKEEQEQILKNIKTQHDKALELFYATLNQIDIGLPSAIELPSLLV